MYSLLAAGIFYTLCTILVLSPFVTLTNDVLDGMVDFSSIPKRAFLQLGAIFLFCQLIVYKVFKDRSFYLNSLDVTVLIFISWCTVSTVGAQNGYLAQQKLAHLLACLLTYLAVRFTCMDWDEVKFHSLFGVMSFSMTCVSIIGLLQLFHIEPAFLGALYPIGSTFGNMSFAVGYLVTFLPFSIFFFARSNSTLRVAIHWTAATFSIAYCIYAGCRAGWLSIFAISAFAAPALFVNRKHVPGLKKVKVPLGVFACILIFVPTLLPYSSPYYASAPLTLSSPGGTSETKPSVGGSSPLTLPSFNSFAQDRVKNYTSSQERKKVWMDCLKMIEKRPFHGFGLGNFRTFYPAFHPFSVKEKRENNWLRWSNAHNEFLESAVEQGLPGFLTFVLILIMSFRSSVLIMHRKTGDMMWVGMASLGSLLAFLPMAFFWFPMENVLLPFCLFLIMALLSSGTECKESVHVSFPNGKILACCFAIPFAVYIQWGCSFDYLDVRSYIHYAKAQEASLRMEDAEVLRHARHALAYNPRYLNALNLAGVACTRLERLEEAALIYEELLKYDPYQLFVIARLANIYEKVGRGMDERKLYTTILGTMPDRAGDLMEKISEIRSE